MVNATSICLLTLLALGQAANPDQGPGTTVKSALGKGNYPWYDPEEDAVKPLALPPVDEPDRARSSSSASMLDLLGNVLAIVGFLLGLAALIGLLAWFWKIYEPGGEGVLEPSKGRGGSSKIEALPPGLRREFDLSDPWEEALRRRDQGDLAGAVVCLFAHQLLTLSRLGLVRLAPGRTGRQLLRAVADGEFRGLAHPTLRQFEAVYYGHRTPSLVEFEEVWKSAEAFERRVAGGGAS